MELEVLREMVEEGHEAEPVVLERVVVGGATKVEVNSHRVAKEAEKAAGAAEQKAAETAVNREVKWEV